MEKPEILPCPFCGHHEELSVKRIDCRSEKQALRYGPSGFYQVECYACGATGPRHLFGTPYGDQLADEETMTNAAIVAWNLRAEVFQYALDAVQEITEAYVKKIAQR